MSEVALGGIARLVCERVDTTIVAHLEGEVDLSNAEDLGRALKENVPGDVDALVIDLERTTYIDSSGIRTLFVMKGHLKQRRQELRLVLPSGSVLCNVLEISGVTGALVIHENVAAAVS